MYVIIISVFSTKNYSVEMSKKTHCEDEPIEEDDISMSSKVLDINHISSSCSFSSHEEYLHIYLCYVSLALSKFLLLISLNL